MNNMNSMDLAWKIRKDIVEMIHDSHASHIASALSAADIIAVLYADVLRFDAGQPQMKTRDRFILSKGHAGSALYAALAEIGFFSVDELKKYYTNGSIYSGHVSHKEVPGVELSTGSLGHGIAVACGMALAARNNKYLYQVYTLIGDGECNEGVVWETALAANQFSLDNFTVIIDRNKMQAMGNCESILKMEPMADKWRSFGWNVVEVTDGHDHNLLKHAFSVPSNGHPKCVIAETIKGKGISFMENNILWHYRDPQGETYRAAIAELEDQKP